jgi:outer membrane protein TolC
MNLRAAFIPLGAVPALLVSGCISTQEQPQAFSPALAFAPVQADVARLSGDRVMWNQHVETDKLVTDEAWDRLQSPLDANAAAQIAVLNSPDLQATFEVIFSQADPVHEPVKGEIARQHLAALQARMTDAAIKLIGEVKSAFYAYQGDLQLRERLKLILQADQADADLANKQQQGGNLNKLAALNQQAQVASVQIALGGAEKDTIASREKLNRLMGLSGAAIVWVARPELPPLPAQDPGTAEVEILALDQRRDLQALREETDAVGQELGLRIFGQGQGEVLAAQHSQLQQRLRSLGIQVESEAREASRTLFVDRQQVEFFKKTVVPLNIATVNQTLEQFNAVQLNSDELFLARQRELEAERDYIHAWRDYWIARSELEEAVGGNLTLHQP